MAGGLEGYNQKRHFEKTSEPEGKLEETGKQLRFVVQNHSARRDHFDFRLEWGGVLLSWAIPKGPSYDPRDKRLAVEVEDHPLEYRDFEGTIPKGEYGGGTVMIWDEGYWEPQADFDQGRTDGSLKIVLYGKRLKGKWALVRLKARPEEAKNNWLIVKERDEYAQDNDGISEFDTSVSTGRTMSEIAEDKTAEGNDVRNPFYNTNVQLAKLVDTAPEGADWLYELKYDGYRIIAYIEGGKVKLITRNGQDYTKKFNKVADSLSKWFGSRAAVLDGEVVIINAKGRTDFQALQNHIKSPKGERLTYIIFDLLALDGADLRNKKLIERKEKLETILEGAPHELYYSKHLSGNGQEIFVSACRADFEGVVCKRADSIYSGTRNGDWVKMKCRARQEFVIGGYTVSDKKTDGFSSVILGVYDGNDLVYAGRAGTGFTERSTKALKDKFDEINSETSFFKNTPKPRAKEDITWLKPILVAEIEFAEWTDDNLLRQGSFKGLRDDKQPGEVRREQARAGKERA